MDRRDDDAGAIAWPGFVDILSAVIMMFVFFVLITAIAMYVMSVEYKENLAEQNEKRVTEMVSQELSEYVEKIEAGDVTLEDLKKSFEYEEKVQTLETEKEELTKEKRELTYDMQILSQTLEQIKADFAENLEQSTTTSDGFFVVFFSRNDISVSEDTTAAIKAFLDTHVPQDERSRVKIKVLAPDNPNAPTISVSRELALARSLNVRNALIENGIDTASISVNYVKAEKIQDSYNWIKIGVAKK